MAGIAWPVFAQSPAAPPVSQSGVTASQLFAIADAARDRGDYRSAEIACRAPAGAPDRGYADATGTAGAYLFHEFGRTTLVAGASHSHLAADVRLFLYPERPCEDRLSGNISATFSALTFHSFSPFARLVVEHNRSTVEICSFSRVAGEFGLTSAF